MLKKYLFLTVCSLYLQAALPRNYSFPSALWDASRSALERASHTLAPSLEPRLARTRSTPTCVTLNTLPPKHPIALKPLNTTTLTSASVVQEPSPALKPLTSTHLDLSVEMLFLQEQLVAAQKKNPQRKDSNSPPMDLNAPVSELEQTSRSLAQLSLNQPSNDQKRITCSPADLDLLDL